MLYDHVPEAKRLKNFGRIAIWNWEKIVIVIAAVIWATDVSLLIKGRYLL
jgi:hypothetical protein